MELPSHSSLCSPSFMLPWRWGQSWILPDSINLRHCSPGLISISQLALGIGSPVCPWTHDMYPTLSIKDLKDRGEKGISTSRQCLRTPTQLQLMTECIWVLVFWLLNKDTSPRQGLIHAGSPKATGTMQIPSTMGCPAHPVPTLQKPFTRGPRRQLVLITPTELLIDELMGELNFHEYNYSHTIRWNQKKQLRLKKKGCAPRW